MALTTILIIMMLNLMHQSSVISKSESLSIGNNSNNITLTNTPFCNSIEGAVSRGSSDDRLMIHAFVSNTGHFPFLHNVLLSMKHSGIDWKPLVLSIGAGVCSRLANVTELQDQYICVPYLERLFQRLQRDEPESVEQISDKLKANTTANEHSNSTRFSDIDNTFYGWGTVEHKFLINSKLYALRDILDCGADAFITDTDIGFRTDPRPYFAIDGKEGDIVAQNDTNNAYQLSLNSGLMYWKNTTQNRDLIQDIITVPPFWHVDQARVNSRMYNHSTPHTLLDAYLFPNGHMLNDHFDKLNDTVVFHANWNSERGQKEGMLRKMGLWFLRNESHAALD